MSTKVPCALEILVAKAKANFWLMRRVSLRASFAHHRMMQQLLTMHGTLIFFCFAWQARTMAAGSTACPLLHRFRPEIPCSTY